MEKSSLVKKIYSLILKILRVRRLRNLIVDSHTRVVGHDSKLSTIFWETSRYRLAGISVPLTQNEKRLLKFKNLHKGQRAFIIGNGKSLNKCNLRLLKNEITFGVNAIYLNYEKMGFYPTYYIVEDVFVAEDRAHEINSLHGPTKFFGNYLNYCLSDSEDVLWLNVRVNYRDYPDFPHFSENAARMIWVGGTVSYISLQLAYFMGFSELYLIGFDHLYQIPKDAQVAGYDILSTSDDPNHFAPSYFGKGYRWHDPKVERMELALLKAKKSFFVDGRKIFNATVGGQLEVFPRVNYSELF